MNNLLAYFEVVFPQKQLSPWERLMLLSLYASNNLECGEKFVVKLGRVAQLAGASESSARLYLRSLAEKGVIDIEGYGRDGYSVLLVPPLAIPGVVQDMKVGAEEIDLELIDFFTDRRFVRVLLERQGGACFYSLRKLDEQSCELDHLIPQGRGGDNSYRNIVCCSFEMNKRKGDQSASDFLRALYRSGFLSEKEFEQRLLLLHDIECGKLKPTIEASERV